MCNSRAGGGGAGFDVCRWDIGMGPREGLGHILVSSAHTVRGVGSWSDLDLGSIGGSRAWTAESSDRDCALVVLWAVLQLGGRASLMVMTMGGRRAPGTDHGWCHLRLICVVGRQERST